MLAEAIRRLSAGAGSQSQPRSRPQSRAGPTWNRRRITALGIVVLGAAIVTLVAWGAGAAVATAAQPGVDEVRRYASIGNGRVILLIPEDICPSPDIQLLLLETATESLRYAEDLFGSYLSHPVVHLWLNAGEKPESVVPPTGAFALATCRVTDESGTVPQTPDEVRKYSFLMVHEYSHLVHMLHMHRTYPALAEGFASLASEYARRHGVQEGELREAAHDDAQDASWLLTPHITAASALAAGILPPIREILTLRRSGQAWKQWMLYTVPSSLLGFIDEEFGRPTLTDVFRHCPEATGPTDNAAGDWSAQDELFDTFERYTGISLDELEALWHRRLGQLRVNNRSIAAVKLLKDLDRTDTISLLWALRASGKKLDLEFLKALAELRADILRFGSLSVAVAVPGSDTPADDDEDTAEMSEQSLSERIDHLAGWAQELWRKAYE